jgi:hypothetical protein
MIIIKYYVCVLYIYIYIYIFIYLYTQFETGQAVVCLYQHHHKHICTLFYVIMTATMSLDNKNF